MNYVNEYASRKKTCYRQQDAFPSIPDDKMAQKQKLL